MIALPTTLSYRDKIVHQYQFGKPNCGPIALSCLFDAPVPVLEKIVGCTARGTPTHGVIEGLQSRGVKLSHVQLGESYGDHLWWIAECSRRWPIYASCTFVNQGRRGRPARDCHAVLFAHGFYYDGHMSREEPIEAIAVKFNKEFVINELVIFEHELNLKR